MAVRSAEKGAECATEHQRAQEIRTRFAALVESSWTLSSGPYFGRDHDELERSAERLRSVTGGEHTATLHCAVGTAPARGLEAPCGGLAAQARRRMGRVGVTPQGAAAQEPLREGNATEAAPKPQGWQEGVAGEKR